MGDLTITEFLLARVAEDEERVNRWADRGVLWPHAEHDTGECNECDNRQSHRNADDAIYARVLAECESKRRIIAEHPEKYGECVTCFDREFTTAGDYVFKDWPCPTLVALAQPYADHPDFDPSWTT